MNLISIAAFKDNYIWILINNQNSCIIVDPGEAVPVLTMIEEHGWQPEAILLTHHHYDHLGGVTELQMKFPNLPVYGPAETQGKGVTQVVHGGEDIRILQQNFFIFATPGHTFGHLCYYSPPYLFCGDTLFSGGCGRLFEGTSFQMYQSFQRINALPEKTIICCGHEYTLENMKFAKSIPPNNFTISEYFHRVKRLRTKNQKTLPVKLKNERKVNLFLRANNEREFAWLRSKKDNFNASGLPF